jgi:hypothetical protein
MMQKLRKLITDKHDQIVIFQSPNTPLLLWFTSSVLARITSGTVHNGFASLATAMIVVWAYLEITSGVTPARRLLGGLVMTVVVAHFFGLTEL